MTNNVLDINKNNSTDSNNNNQHQEMNKNNLHHNNDSLKNNNNNNNSNKIQKTINNDKNNNNHEENNYENQYQSIRKDNQNIDQDLLSIKLKVKHLAIKGVELAKQNEFNKAIEKFTEAIKNDSTDHRLYGNRSYCFDKINNFEECVFFFSFFNNLLDF
jgi:Flp pilus assembly protein TadD